MDALQSTMKAVLKIHEKEANAEPEPRPLVRWKKVEDIPAYAPFKGMGCVHCHMVNDFSQKEALDRKTASKDMFRRYPPPENWGIKLERDDTTRVKSVSSFAEEAGIKQGDVLKSVNDVPIRSQGDLFFAMNLAPDKGSAAVVIERDGKEQALKLYFEGEWRKSDISWRRSIWSSGLGAFTAPLNAGQKKKHGLEPGNLALTVQFIQPDSPADKAGLKANDVITAVGGVTKSMDQAHFQAYLLQEFDPGDAVELTILRGGETQTIELRFPR
jgi:C-terminal processing protease CtpA/Prc